MACEFPVAMFYARELNPSGRRSLVSDVRKALNDTPVYVPCQFCINCRLARANLWTARCLHEFKMHQTSANAFITLTYDDIHLPEKASLVRRHPALFMKRLRKAHGNGVRMFGCGEYGETTGRPHYHILLFNTGFGDGVKYKVSKTGEPLFRSAELSRLWSDDIGCIGECNFGAVSVASIKYVAGYVTKRVRGPKADAHYNGRLPEFAMWSLGLGSSWFDKFHPEVIKADSIIVDGVEMALPRYYNTRYVDFIDQNMSRSAFDKSRMAQLKRARRAQALEAAARDDQSMRRRATRERYVELKSQLFKRDV